MEGVPRTDEQQERDFERRISELESRPAGGGDSGGTLNPDAPIGGLEKLSQIIFPSGDSLDRDYNRLVYAMPISFYTPNLEEITPPEATLAVPYHDGTDPWWMWVRRRFISGCYIDPNIDLDAAAPDDPREMWDMTTFQPDSVDAIVVDGQAGLNAMSGVSDYTEEDWGDGPEAVIYYQQVNGRFAWRLSRIAGFAFRAS